MSRRKQAKPQHFQSDPEVASLPRRDGECSGPRRGHTRAHTHALTLTHTRTHAHAAGPRARRPRGPARPGGSALLGFLSGVRPAFPAPAAARRADPPPAGPSRSRRVLPGEESGRAGLAPASPRFPGAGPRPAARPPGAGRPAGRGAGRRPSAPAAPGSRAPRARPGPPAGPPPPGPAAGGKKVDCVPRAGPELGTPRAPPAVRLGLRRLMGCLWGSRAARRWGPVSGRPRRTRWGRGGAKGLLPVAPETGQAPRGGGPAARLHSRISSPSTCTPAPRNPSIRCAPPEDRGTPVLPGIAGVVFQGRGGAL